MRVMLAGLLLAALIAGCGSGAPSKAQFITRADAICASSLSQIRATASVAAVAKLVAVEAHKLTGLAEPTAGRAEIHRYLEAERASAADWQQLATAERGHGQTAAAVATALATLNRNPAAHLAQAYGLRTCSGAGATVGS